MVYRTAPGDPRVAELRSIIDGEPVLRDEARRLRFLQDEANEKVDEANAKIRDARGWFGRGRADHALEEQAAEARARLEKLVEDEREVLAKIEEVGEARRELATRESAAVQALRASKTPAGEELRAIDAQAEIELGIVAVFERVLAALVRAETVLVAIADARIAVREASLRQDAFAAVVDAVDGLTDLAAARTRLRDALATAQVALKEIVVEVDALGGVWGGAAPLLPRDAIAAFAATMYYVREPEKSSMIAASGQLATSVSELIAVVEREHGRLRARCDALAAEQSALAMRYLEGG
ncbi:MAG TPA: hypothetical protein VGM56_29370 [Byssovorax sp.]|jgi:hypothetical protein